MRTQAYKKRVSPGEMKEKALSLPKGGFEFEKALRKPELSFICECKKASPSKGVISYEFPYLEIAHRYEKAGADCISVLTEPKWFLGKDEYLRQISQQVTIPCLRKDFTVNDYMIYEAKLMGAKAVLLICSILTPEQLKEYIQVCDTLGISALVEVHDADEVKTALNAGARVIGVNNRDLKDFSVDTENSLRLRDLVPSDVVFVSESGVSCAEDVKRLYDAGVNAVLIGEALMRSPNKAAKIEELRSAL
jgi:indole-3-glycerol phosphate synthase